MDLTKRTSNRLVMVALCLVTFIVSTDMMAANLILPSVSNSLQSTLAQLQWIIAVYSIVSAMFCVIAGRLGDIIGPKKIFLVGLIVFMLASLLAGVSSSIVFLIFFRAVQGIGYALILALSNVIVQESMPKERLGQTLGLLAGVGALAAALGPLLVGMILQFLNWRWVFFINVPICFFVIVLVAVYVIDRERNGDVKKFDYVGAVLMVLGLFFIMLSLNNAAAWGVLSTRFWACIITGLFLLCLFYLIEEKMEDPLIHLRGIFTKAFIAVNCVRVIVSFVLFSLLFAVVLYLKTVFNYSPMDTGLLFVFISIAMIISAVFAGKLIDRFGPYKWLIMACIIMVLYFIFFALADSDHFGVLQYVLFFLAGLALGLVRPGLSYIILNIVPEEHLGTSNAISSTLIPLGGAIGVAVSGWVVDNQSTHYLYQILQKSHLQLPASVLPLVLKMAKGIKTPLELSLKVSKPMYEKLVLFSKQAFLSAYSDLMVISAVLFFIALLLILFSYKQTRLQENLKG